MLSVNLTQRNYTGVEISRKSSDFALQLDLDDWLVFDVHVYFRLILRRVLRVERVVQGRLRALTIAIGAVDHSRRHCISIARVRAWPINVDRHRPQKLRRTWFKTATGAPYGVRLVCGQMRERVAIAPARDDSIRESHGQPARSLSATRNPRRRRARTSLRLATMVRGVCVPTSLRYLMPAHVSHRHAYF